MDTPTFPPEDHQSSTCVCPHPSCPLRGQRGAGHSVHRSWTGKDKRIERLRCTHCRQEFSARRGLGATLQIACMERWYGTLRGLCAAARAAALRVSAGTTRGCGGWSTSTPVCCRRRVCASRAGRVPQRWPSDWLSTLYYIVRFQVAD